MGGPGSGRKKGGGRGKQRWGKKVKLPSMFGKAKSKKAIMGKKTQSSVYAALSKAYGKKK